MAKSEHHATNHAHNPLWTYSIKQYSRPAVESFLLDAQDHQNMNINVLLLVAWLASQQQTFLPQIALNHHHFLWLLNKTERVRSLRRRAKEFPSESFYNALKQLELSLEKRTINLLFSQAGQMPHFLSKSFEESAKESLERYFTYQQRPLCERWLKEFSQLFKP